MTFVESPTRVAQLQALAEALAGDLAAFKARPRFSTLITVASPFAMDGALLDVHAAAAAFGAPVEVFVVPMTGGTSPITLAGTITQGMAEFLGALCFLQTLAPGARLLMGAAPSVLDMRNSTLSYAAPETALMGAACTEVAHSLDLPVIAAGMASDAKHPGVQSGCEKALKGLTLSAAGADLQSGGVGTLEAAALLSLPQAVIDDEIAAMIRCALQDVTVDEESILRTPWSGSGPEAATWVRPRPAGACAPSCGPRSSPACRTRPGGNQIPRRSRRPPPRWTRSWGAVGRAMRARRGRDGAGARDVRSHEHGSMR